MTLFLSCQQEGFKRVQIISTLGPASASENGIESLILAGVTIFRLNFSHGTHDDHRFRFETIRSMAKKHDRSIGILADLQGPKLRVGDFIAEKVAVSKGQTFRLDLSPSLGDATRVQLPHPQIFDVLFVGAKLLIDDGKVALDVTEHGKDYAICTVLNDGFISNHKGVNFPSAILDISPLTEKDLKDLDFVLALGVDYVALSFVQRPEDVRHARSIIKGRAKIVSKLEKPSIVEHMDAIVAESDCIMVARGDLGVELPAATIPAIQKKIVACCRNHQKPVIIATQMLESMISSPVPTRAEISDVANAVYDGADAVMLSAETAAGTYPILAVNAMLSTIIDVEKDPLFWQRMRSPSFSVDASSCANMACTPIAGDNASALAAAVALQSLAQNNHAALMLSISMDSILPLAVASMRSCVPHIALVPSESAQLQLVLAWGVQVHAMDMGNDIHHTILTFVQQLHHDNIIKLGDTVSVLIDSRLTKPQPSPMGHMLYTLTV